MVACLLIVPGALLLLSVYRASEGPRWGSEDTLPLPIEKSFVINHFLSLFPTGMKRGKSCACTKTLRNAGPKIAPCHARLAEDQSRKGAGAIGREVSQAWPRESPDPQRSGRFSLTVARSCLERCLGNFTVRSVCSSDSAHTSASEQSITYTGTMFFSRVFLSWARRCLSSSISSLCL
jgi:hypothetical protein